MLNTRGSATRISTVHFLPPLPPGAVVLSDEIIERSDFVLGRKTTIPRAYRKSSLPKLPFDKYVGYKSETHRPHIRRTFATDFKQSQSSRKVRSSSENSQNYVLRKTLSEDPLQASKILERSKTHGDIDRSKKKHWVKNVLNSRRLTNSADKKEYLQSHSSSGSDSMYMHVSHSLKAHAMNSEDDFIEHRKPIKVSEEFFCIPGVERIIEKRFYVKKMKPKDTATYANVEKSDSSLHRAPRIEEILDEKDTKTASEYSNHSTLKTASSVDLGGLLSEIKSLKNEIRQIHRGQDLLLKETQSRQSQSGSKLSMDDAVQTDRETDTSYKKSASTRTSKITSENETEYRRRISETSSTDDTIKEETPMPMYRQANSMKNHISPIVTDYQQGQRKFNNLYESDNYEFSCIDPKENFSYARHNNSSYENVDSDDSRLKEKKPPQNTYVNTSFGMEPQQTRNWASKNLERPPSEQKYQTQTGGYAPKYENVRPFIGPVKTTLSPVKSESSYTYDTITENNLGKTSLTSPRKSESSSSRMSTERNVTPFAEKTSAFSKVDSTILQRTFANGQPQIVIRPVMNLKNSDTERSSSRRDYAVKQVDNNKIDTLVLSPYPQAKEQFSNNTTERVDVAKKLPVINPIDFQDENKYPSLIAQAYGIDVPVNALPEESAFATQTPAQTNSQATSNYYNIQHKEEFWKSDQNVEAENPVAHDNRSILAPGKESTMFDSLVHAFNRIHTVDDKAPYAAPRNDSYNERCANTRADGLLI